MLRSRRPAKPRSSAPRSINVEAPCGTIEILVKRSRRARRMLLKLDAAGDGFSLTLPPFDSLGEATTFAHSQARWMAERLAQVPPRIPFGDGALVPSYNAQISTDAEQKVIVGVHLSSCSSDAQSLMPALAVVEQQVGQSLPIAGFWLPCPRPWR